MDPSKLALGAVEMITHLKDELARSHDRVVLLGQHVAEKQRCIQGLTDSLMLRVIKSRTQKSSSG